MTPYSNDETGWALHRLDEVCEVNPARDYGALGDDSEISLVPMAAIEEGTGRLDASEHVTLGSVRKKSLTHFREGDVVVAKISPSFENGKVALARGLRNGYAAGTTELNVFRPGPALDRRYLLYFLLSYDVRMPLTRTFAGTVGQQRIALDQLKSVRLPIPPLPEQQAIVEAIEQTMSHLAVAESRLSDVQRRISVLNASALHQVTSVRNAPTVALTEIAEVVAGPAFKSAQFADDARNATRLVRGSNVAPGRLHWGVAETEYWPDALLSDYEKYLLMEGDVILAMDRPVISTGLKLAMTQTHDPPALLVQRVARIRANDPALARWIYLCLLAPSFIPHMLTDTTGTQLPHITLEGIRSFRIPDLSADEVTRRVDAGDAVLSQSQRLAATGTASLERVHALRRTTLKAAFEGRLTGNRSLSDGVLDEAIA